MTKSLSKAIALATLVGATASAQAMNINQDGLGEVLLYSLYTAEEGNITNISITNTSDKPKAVKVRFVEGQNSQDVLDFNLYMSAHDQWSGAVTATETGARLITADKSCTAPAIPAAGVDFRNYDYVGDKGEQSLARTRVGHVEVIEMGTITDPKLVKAVTAETAPGAAPANCGAIIAEFSNKNTWGVELAEEKTVTPEEFSKIQTGIEYVEGAKNSLYGSASVLNIAGSTEISYDAVAIENFLVASTGIEGDTATQTLHAKTGSVNPGLNSVRLKSADTVDAVFKDGSGLPYASSVQAISALLAKSSINNNFVLDEARGSKTNWVVTFPTKRFHVDAKLPENIVGGSTDTRVAAAPFDKTWAVDKANSGLNTATSCHSVGISYWDNEEYKVKKADSVVDFSPSPVDVSVGPQLCYETNILSFNDAKMLGGEFVGYNVNLAQPDFQFGWMRMDFSGYKDAQNVTGLPVIGFSATTVSNNTTANGLANNYGSSTAHKAVGGKK